jgi:glycosyltransferase involved in cell wall biosynthesis
MYHGSMESGGQGVYLANITRELARRGHDVHVISAPPYPELDPAVVHHRLRTHSFQSMLLDRGAFFGGRPPLSHFHPLNFFEFASSRFTFSSLIAVFSLRALQELKRIEAADGPFDVIHDNQTLSYGVYLMKALVGRPVVANVHHPLDVDLANGLRHVAGTMRKAQRIAWYPWHMQHLVSRRLDALISGSRASAELVSRLWNLRPGLMHTIYDGVDVDRFHPGAGGEVEPRSVLFVGNAEDYNKGIVYLLRAMALLPARSRPRLYVVGGPQGESLVVRGEVERLGIGGSVEYVGRVPAKELEAWYRRAQVLVSPSLYEGFGLPIVEAMASGMAVIATDGGAPPELVVQGETGLIVPAASPEALAEAIASLVDSPERCRALGAAGRGRAVREFTWERCALGTEALYTEVIAGRRARQSN